MRGRGRLRLAWSAPLAPAPTHYVGAYRKGRETECPGCGRHAWLVGRIYAECAFCGFAIPIAGERPPS